MTTELGKGKIAMARWQLVSGDSVGDTCANACLSNNLAIAMLGIGIRSCTMNCHELPIIKDAKSGFFPET